MKSIVRETGLLFIIFILVINSCKKEEVPLLTTAAESCNGIVVDKKPEL